MREDTEPEIEREGTKIKREGTRNRKGGTEPETEKGGMPGPRTGEAEELPTTKNELIIDYVGRPMLVSEWTGLARDRSPRELEALKWREAAYERRELNKWGVARWHRFRLMKTEDATNEQKRDLMEGYAAAAKKRLKEEQGDGDYDSPWAEMEERFREMRKDGYNWDEASVGAATGRIPTSWRERPGLMVRPRDRQEESGEEEDSGRNPMKQERDIERDLERERRKELERLKRAQKRNQRWVARGMAKMAMDKKQAKKQYIILQPTKETKKRRKRLIKRLRKIRKRRGVTNWDVRPSADTEQRWEHEYRNWRDSRRRLWRMRRATEVREGSQLELDLRLKDLAERRKEADRFRREKRIRDKQEMAEVSDEPVELTTATEECTGTSEEGSTETEAEALTQEYMMMKRRDARYLSDSGS